MLLCPLRVSDEARASKLFVMGVHPQRLLDEGYIEFAKSLADILAASLKTIKFVQETEAEQARLEEELQRRTLEVELEETRFARLAASAPVAIWIENLTDGIKFRNEKWWEIHNILKTPISLSRGWTSSMKGMLLRWTTSEKFFIRKARFQPSSN
jgi:PAS domain-containing protein